MSKTEQQRRRTRRGLAYGMALVLGLSVSADAALVKIDADAQNYLSANGEVISADKFNTHFYTYARSKLYHGGSKEKELELRIEAAKDLITDRLMLVEAGNRKIKSDKKEIDKKIQDLVKRYEGSKGWEKAKENLPAIRHKFEEDDILARLKEVVSEVSAPGAQELEEFHTANVNLFTEPEKYHLHVILLKVDPSAAAADWAARQEEGKIISSSLREGGGFADIATGVSQHDSAGTGGDVGFVHLDQLYEPAQEIVAEMKSGEISEPVRVLEGWVIFKLDAKEPAKVQPLSVVEERAGALYVRETAKSQWATFQESLWETAMIVASPEAAALVE